MMPACSCSAVAWRACAGEVFDDQRPQLEVADIIERGGETDERAFGVVAQEGFVFLGAGAKRF